MPLTAMSGRMILTETAAKTEAGKGMCVGTPLAGITLRIIKITDTPIATWDEAMVVPTGEIGEIIVKGPVVTRTYLNRPEKTAVWCNSRNGLHCLSPRRSVVWRPR